MFSLPNFIVRPNRDLLPIVDTNAERQWFVETEYLKVVVV